MGPQLRSYIVDNEHSTARDQFAAERNFLSWLKLAMAVVASSIIIFHDFVEQNTTYSWLATVSTVYFFVLALLLLLVSTVFFWKTQGSLATEQKPMRLFTPLFLQVVGYAGAASLVFVLAISYSKTL
ncbi:hypothetical protein BX667DRAFT_393603 [Coemansia mojavensis]|nr:hypothetical protein BX667DRAFT_220622 [Coemansia mojavensis]KAI9472967.1 hypothetical protein BX667DRAFT_393603 [Coemansia mojavensis]